MAAFFGTWLYFHFIAALVTIFEIVKVIFIIFGIGLIHAEDKNGKTER